MTRLYRITTIGLIWIFAIIMHWFGATLFAPGAFMYELGEVGVGTYIEEGWRDQMYLVFVQFIPLLFVGMSLAWGFAKEYEDAVNTRYR